MLAANSHRSDGAVVINLPGARGIYRDAAPVVMRWISLM